ncbi:MAG: ABC transporter ATP-binding protein [Candidatus Thermoplasmatota archaeon]|nr:ABC transporter ATP-binding protein [Candidatus Thermoplasmatota archaeon]
MREDILYADHLYHIYESKAEDGNVVALRGLHVKVREGEAVAVVGPSGSGKSTLLKCLGGLMKPSAGSVVLNQKNMTRVTGQELVELRQNTVSFIFQEGNLLPNMSALDNVAQPLRHQHVPPGEAKKRARELLIKLGLEERIHGLPATLSGGEQQRVAIARALITNPKIILADEPTGALDPITSRDVLALFKKLHKEEGVAFLIVTHSAEVADFCDRALELRDGRFIAQHGDGFEVDELSESRELIIDEMGTVTFPPDMVLEMGGAGRWIVEDVAEGRISLTSAEEQVASVLDGREGTLADICPACKHEYSSDAEQLCPECGSSRPIV